MNSKSTEQTSVFIVGGGPVGLAMALLLDRFEIDFVLVEKNATTTDHPKSRGCWSRTMELFRQWGIEEKVRNRGLNANTDIFVYSESIAGKEVGRTSPEHDAGLTPAWKSLVAQDVVEEEILDVVRHSKFGQILFSTEYTGFEETGDGVIVTARPVGADVSRTWKARYLIAADGPGSRTRKSAGIEMKGPATLAVMANNYWRADLSRVPVARTATGFRIVPANPEEPVCTVLSTNGRDRWLTISQIGTEKDDRERPWTDEEIVSMARQQAGIPDLNVEVINSSVWKVSRQVAESFSRGRVFIVGDAAHRFPPMGGFGLNSGVQDAHNLAWKIAYVLRGWASDQLLDSYDPERRPVAHSNADWSLGNYSRFRPTEEAIVSGDKDRIDFWINDTNRHMHSLGQVLGFTYESAAVVSDGTVPKPLNPERYEPTDRPGSRFPHLWLDTSRQQSTLDWFDKHFVLVAGHRGDEWIHAVEGIEGHFPFPVLFRQLPVADRRDGFGMGPRGAALVRPDGHVAWRIPYLPKKPADALCAALGQVVGARA
jgi:2-polyprenyl-6-methoxyphenol hydroxylase-like FAD-dependent oxidoreductase